jgi:hypothetical protein
VPSTPPDPHSPDAWIPLVQLEWPQASAAFNVCYAGYLLPIPLQPNDLRDRVSAEAIGTDLSHGVFSRGAPVGVVLVARRGRAAQLTTVLVGPILRVLLAITVAAAPSLVAAAPYKAPRNAAGQPDLQGVWTDASLTKLERPKEFHTLTINPKEAAAYERGYTDHYRKAIAPDAAKAAPPPVEKVGPSASQWYEAPEGLARIDGRARTSWIVDPPDGHLPLTETARSTERAAEFADHNVFDNPDARPIDERCIMGPWLPAGPPLVNPSDNTLLQIVQTRDYVVIETEMIHDTRIIPLGVGHRSPGGVRPWMGESVGHWDGETLVVETTGFNPGDSWQIGDAYVRMSPAAKVIERFTRTSPSEILYRYEASDPVYFTRPWRGEMPLRATHGPLFEFACHEGNYSFENTLAGARKTDKDAAPQPPAHDSHP